MAAVAGWPDALDDPDRVRQAPLGELDPACQVMLAAGTHPATWW